MDRKEIPPLGILVLHGADVSLGNITYIHTTEAVRTRFALKEALDRLDASGVIPIL